MVAVSAGFALTPCPSPTGRGESAQVAAGNCRYWPTSVYSCADCAPWQPPESAKPPSLEQPAGKQARRSARANDAVRGGGRPRRNRPRRPAWPPAAERRRASSPPTPRLLPPSVPLLRRSSAARDRRALLVPGSGTRAKPQAAVLLPLFTFSTESKRRTCWRCWPTSIRRRLRWSSPTCRPIRPPRRWRRCRLSCSARWSAASPPSTSRARRSFKTWRMPSGDA